MKKSHPYKKRHSRLSHKLYSYIKIIFLIFIIFFCLILLFHFIFQSKHPSTSTKNPPNLSSSNMNPSIEDDAMPDSPMQDKSDIEPSAPDRSDVIPSNTNADTALSSTTISTTTSSTTSSTLDTTDLEPDSINRITYQEGFWYDDLSLEIQNKIDGISYHENDTISFEDLRILNVQYIDFNSNTQNGELICNVSIAQDLIEIFYELYQNRYPIDKIRLIDEYNADDDLSCEDDNTSCFNYRVIAGTDKLSNHALGMAIDINPFYNPYITYKNGVENITPKAAYPYADRTCGNPYMISNDDLCCRLFKEHGFTWGGDYKSCKDYQHFEK